MLLDWIDNLGLLSQDPGMQEQVALLQIMNVESNVLLSFPAPVRKALISEVVGYLYQSCAVAGMAGVSSSTASTPTVLMSSIAAASTGSNVPYTISAMTPTSETGLGALTTQYHVRWTMEVLAQAFNLPLEDISIISNAASVYIQWLVEPSKRPLAISKADEETQQKFIQTVFRHVSLLFQPKKVDGVGAAKPLLATLASKHVEVCKLMLRTLNQVALSSQTEVAMEGALKMSTATWKVLLRVLLGVTDYLLRVPTQPYCYLSEELGEALLSNLIELWLRSQIFSADMWKALRSCYPTWAHRLLVISHWSAVSLALTQRVTRVLYGQGTQAVVYTVHSSLVTLDLNDRYVVYAWHQFSHLIGGPNQLQPSLFFRSVLGMEKLVQVFHSIGASSASTVMGVASGSGAEGNVAIERHFPDGNTILHLFGSWLFEAVSRSGSDCVEGRAQAFGILCRIFARPQMRTPFLATYLHQFYSAVIDGLRGDLMSLVFIVVNCEDIFALGLPGVRILIAPFVIALRRIIPELEKPLRVSLNLDDLRRACYKLLCTIFGCCNHFGLVSLKALLPLLPEGEASLGDSMDGIISNLVIPVEGHQRKVTRSGSTQGVTDGHFFIEQLRDAYRPLLGQLSLAKEEITLGHVRFVIMELLVASFCNEKDPGNQRYLINTLTTFTIDEARKVPALSAVIIGLFEDHLMAGQMSVEACLVATEALHQFASSPFVPALLAHRPDAVRRLVLSLCSVAGSFISRNNLPLLLKPIMALYDCILDWILGATNFSASLAWFANDLDCQSAFIQVLVKGISFGSSSAPGTVTSPGGGGGKKESANEIATSTTPASKKSAGSLTPGTSSVGGLSPAGSMNLTITNKSLESQLVMASEIALARLVNFYGLGLSNHFSPVHMSSMINEALLLSSADPSLNYRAASPRKLTDLNREQINCLRYFILNGNTIACFVERPIEPGMPSEQTTELVTLMRSLSGRFSWENALVYRLANSPEIVIDNDPSSMEPPAQLRNEHQLYAPVSILADGYEYQAELCRSHEELGSLPVQVDTLGPVYNGDLAAGRFAADDKRLLNYNCIDSLARQQVDRTSSSLIHEGASLRNYRARPAPKCTPEGQFSRLLIAHSGMASLRCRDSIVRLPPCVELLSDLEILDSLPERETISCAVLFVRSGRQSLEEILGERAISSDFGTFMQSLGWSVDLATHPGWVGSYREEFAKTAPYYADVDVELVYHSPQLIDTAAYAKVVQSLPSNQIGSPPNHYIREDLPSTLSDIIRFISNDLVCILWIEDLQEMLTLPSKFQTRAIVYICVSPLPDPASSAGLYRIRIMVTSLASAIVPSAPQASSPVGDAVFLFGPLLDGMIVRRETLGRLVRETAISASLFCLYNIQNQPRPLAKRSQFIQHMTNKYRMVSSTPSKYYNELVYNAGP